MLKPDYSPSIFSRLVCASVALLFCVHATAQMVTPAAPVVPGMGGATVATPALGNLSGTSTATGTGAVPRGEAIEALPAAKNIMQQGSNADAKDTAKTTDANAKAADAKNNVAEKDALASEPVKEAKADDTEFQRFVFNATGKALPLYGYELFARSTRAICVVKTCSALCSGTPARLTGPTLGSMMRPSRSITKL